MFEVNKACRATIYHNLQGKKLKLQTIYIYKHIKLKQDPHMVFVKLKGKSPD